jgi:hypothetical protein
MVQGMREKETGSASHLSPFCQETKIHSNRGTYLSLDVSARNVKKIKHFLVLVAGHISNSFKTDKDESKMGIGEATWLPQDLQSEEISFSISSYSFYNLTPLLIKRNQLG